VRRHVQPTREPRNPVQQSPPAATPSAVIREARYVERLAYSRSQAAQALGLSRSTLRRLLPYVDTIEMPWGGRLIPVDELERLLAGGRRAAALPPGNLTRGRKPAVPPQVAKRIRDERSAGKSLRQIADQLNADSVPTAHGGERWWPSTVRAILQRAA